MDFGWNVVLCGFKRLFAFVFNLGLSVLVCGNMFAFTWCIVVLFLFTFVRMLCVIVAVI